jgi:hypothetical protein
MTFPGGAGAYAVQRMIRNGYEYTENADLIGPPVSWWFPIVISLIALIFTAGTILILVEMLK